MKLKELKKKINKSLIVLISIMMGVSYNVPGISVSKAVDTNIIKKNENYNSAYIYKVSNVPGIYFSADSGTSTTKKAVYCYGAPLLCIEENGSTHLYVDKDCDGIVDDGEVKLEDPFLSTDTDKLTGYSIYLAGEYDLNPTSTFKCSDISSDYSNKAMNSTFFTMKSGTINALYGSNHSDNNNVAVEHDGNVYINIEGGTIGFLYVGNNDVSITGKTKVVLNGLDLIKLKFLIGGIYKNSTSFYPAAMGSVVEISGKIQIDNTYLEPLTDQKLVLTGALDSTSLLKLNLNTNSNFETLLIDGSKDTTKTFDWCNTSMFSLNGLNGTYIEKIGGSIYFKNVWETPTCTYNHLTNTISNFDIGGNYRITFSDGISFETGTMTSSTLKVPNTYISKTISSIIKLRIDDVVYDSSLGSNTLSVVSNPAVLLDETGSVSNTISNYDLNMVYRVYYYQGDFFYFAETSATSKTVTRDSVTRSNYKITKILKMDKNNSPAQEVNWAVLPQWPSTSISFNATSGLLSNLVANEKYKVTVKDSSNVEHEIEITTTGTTYDLRDYSVSPITSLTGYSLVSLYCENDVSGSTGTHIDGVVETVTGTILPKETTPTTTFDPETSTLTGLTGGSTYILTSTKSGETSTTETTVPDGGSSQKLNTISGLVGTTVTAIQKKGDGTSTSTSDPSVVSYSVLEAETIPASTTSFTETTAKITGLATSAQYIIKDSEGKIYNLSSDSTGSIDGITNNLLGKTIVSIVKKGDGTTSADSDAQTTNYVFPTKNVTPQSSFDKGTGIISSLEANKTYTLTDSTGVSHDVIADSTGTINLNSATDSDHNSISELNFKSIVQKGNTTDNTLTSDAQTIDYVLYPRETTTGLGYTQTTDTVTGLEVGKSYTVTFDSGAPITFTATATSIDLSTYNSGSLVGKKILTVTKNGVSGTSRDSETLNLTSLNYKVLPHEATPASTYNKATGIISDLVANKTYIIKDSNGNTHEVASDSNGQINFGTNGTLNTLTIKGIVLKARDATYIDSFSQDVTYSLLPTRDVSGATYDNLTGMLTGLEPGTDYKVAFTDGTSHTFTAEGSGSDGYINLLSGTDYIGKTISSIEAEGDGESNRNSVTKDVSTLNYKVLTREATPATTYDPKTAIISGLTGTKTYILTDSNLVDHEVSATDGKIDLTKVTGIGEGSKILMITAKGDGTSTSNSLTESIAMGYKVLTETSTPSGITFDPSTDYLTGLTPETPYILKFTDGSTKVIETASGVTTLDLNTVTEALTKTLVSISAEGNGTTTKNSEELALSGTVLSRETTPASSFDKATGIISGLDANKTYILKDSKGNTHEVTSDANGKIDFNSTNEIKNLTISGIALKARDATYINSLYEEVNYGLIPEKDVSGVAYTQNNNTLTGLKSGDQYTLTFNDGTSINFTATGTTFDLLNYNNGSLLGKTLSTIVDVGDNVNYRSSSAKSLTGKVLGKATTPTTTFDKSSGDIKGLDPNATYTLKDSDGNIYSLTSDASGVINFYNNSEITTKTIVAISKDGDASNSSSDYETGLYYSIMSYESVDDVTYSKDDGSLHNLEVGGSYKFTLTDGTTYSFVATSDTLDLRSYLDGKLIGKSIKSIMKTGSTYSYDSSEKDFSDGEILPKEVTTAKVTYDPTNYKLTGLKPDKEYLIETGTGKTITIKTDGDGVIDLLIHDELVEEKIVSATEKGDGVNTSTSENIVTKEIDTVSKDEYVEKLISDTKKDLKTLIDEAKNNGGDETKINEIQTKYDELIGGTKSISEIKQIKAQLGLLLTDATEDIKFEVKKTETINELTKLKDGLTNTEAIKEVNDAIDKTNNLTSGTAVPSDLDVLVSQTKDVVNFILTKEEAISELTSLKEKATDEKIKDFITKAIDEINNLDKSKDKDSDVLSILTSTKDTVTLKESINKAKDEVNNFNDETKKNNSDLGSSLDEIKDKYISDLDNATSVTEVETIVKNYKEETTNFVNANPIEGRCIIHYFLIALILAYLAYYIVYVLVKKHSEFNLVNIIANSAYLLGCIMFTIFIKCSICLGFSIASWVILLLGVGYLIVRLFLKKKAK